MKTFLLSLLLGSAHAGEKTAADKLFPPGTPAPGFVLNSQEGKPVKLADFHGQWVVLYFYPKDFTRGCTIEAHNFQRDQKQYEKRKAVILGVSMQDADSHKEFCAKEGLNFKLLADVDGKVSKTYGAVTSLVVAKFSSRHTFLIDPAGKIAKVYRDVSPGTHSEDVLRDIDALQAAKK